MHTFLRKLVCDVRLNPQVVLDLSIVIKAGRQEKLVPELLAILLIVQQTHLQLPEAGVLRLKPRNPKLKLELTETSTNLYSVQKAGGMPTCLCCTVLSDSIPYLHYLHA